MYLYTLIFILIQLISELSAQSCRAIYRRPEIRELSPTQLRTFINAVLQLNSTNLGNYYTQSVNIHNNNVPYAHGIPTFLVWHRVYLRRFEMALQRINPSIILPYWDWSRDSQSPERSIVFSSNYFGGNGRRGDYCVNTGPFSMFRVTTPNNHCLRRQFNNGNTIGSFYSPEALESILTRSRTYDDLRQAIEGGPHGTVHVNIGGNNGDMSYMHSPNDPLFYMHHAFVDLLWHEWQQRNPNLAFTYNGRINNRNVQTSDNLVPFNVPVSSALNTRGSGYCYFYNRYSANSRTVSTVTQTVSQVNSTSSSLSRRDINLNIKFGTNLNLKNKIASIVKNNFDKAARNVIKANDRQIRGKIRKPDPLPEAYIKMNFLDVEKVRQVECDLASVVGTLNALDDYIPVAKLL